MPYKNKEDHAKAQDRYRKKLRDLIDEAKELGCVDCGETDPIVLQFDHRDPSQKSFKVGSALGVTGVGRLLKEIKKCDVRCANCHLRRHAK